MRLQHLIFAGCLMMMTAMLSQPYVSSADTTPESMPPTDNSQTSVTRLPNGLTVLVREDDRFPLVSLRLYVHAGSAYERPSEAGISHLLEHMVFKGTEKRPKGAVAAEVERSGGYLNAATSFDYTVYLTDMTEEYWKEGLDVLKDMAFHATLDPQELASEQDVVVAELKRGEDNPGQRIFKAIQQTALAGTPYERPIIGFESTVRAVKTQDIRNYIDRLYQPQSMLLVVCGKVTAAEVVEEAKRQFGDLRNTNVVIPPVDNELTAHGFKAVVEKGPWNRVHLAMALPAYSMNDIRSSQLDVLAQLLGGDASSRFYRTYKYEKRLVNTIAVSNYSFERLGFLYITATLDADKLTAFWESFSQDLATIADIRFSKEEMDRACLNLEDSLYRSKETIGGLAGKLGYFALFGKGEQEEANYLQVLRDTDQTVLSELLQAVVTPQAMTVAALLPQNIGNAPTVGKGAAQPDELTAWSEWFGSVPALQEKLAATADTKKSEPAKQTVGAPEVIDLGHNRKVILIEDKTLPYVSVNLIYTGGDSLLTEKTQGLGTFTASLLGKGTDSLNAMEMEDYLSDRAAAFIANSARQTFSFSMSSPARFTDDMFALLRDVLTKPAMKEEEADRVRENQISRIIASEDQPTGLAFRRLFPFLFKDHPYGFMGLGEKEQVAAFTTKDAVDFWKKQEAQPWVLSVCGDFDKEAIIAAAKSLPAPVDKEILPGAPHWSQEKDLTLTLPGRNQAHLLMVFPAVGYGDADEAGLELLQNILAGQSGLLFKDLRDKQGLGYTVTAIPWRSLTTGAIIFYIGTEPEKMEQAEQGFRTVIDQLHTDLVPQDELERGKNQMRGDYYRGRQSLGSRSSEAAGLAILHRPLDSSLELVEQAGAVDAEKLRALAQKYLDPSKAYVVKVLP